MTVGSLFSGIGGLDLGLERAGMRVIWQVEKDEYCRKVLAKHWPDVTRYEDVCDVGRHNLEPVELICGGFPCQPVSSAARGRNRSDRWLWPDFGRIVGELRPRYVFVENVPGLAYRGRGMGLVLGDLAAHGYYAEWATISAASVGAPHIRARLWLVAYADGNGESVQPVDAETSILSGFSTPVPWPDPPRGLRVADGVPARVDRLRALGNAVVPQVAEWIGRRIMDAATTGESEP